MEWVNHEASDEAIKELAEKSSLPHSPNRKMIDQLCIRIVEEWLRY